MVKAYYVCEVCQRHHDIMESAEKCENAIPPQFPPKGMVFGNHRSGAMYSDITFAISIAEMKGHFIRCASYACRSIKYGDSLGDVGGLCDAAPSKGKLNNYLDPLHPTFIRMVSFLQSKGISVTVWDGEEVLTLIQYMSIKS